MKRREAKSKGEKERYKHLNAEFQRIARRDKKKSLLQQSMQRNRGKEQNGKTRDLFKKIRDSKGKFDAEMGLIKDRNCLDLTEAEDIKKRCKNTHLHDPDNHNGVNTHLETDILECEVKWALGSITMNKASAGMELHWSYFKFYKMML